MPALIIEDDHNIAHLFQLALSNTGQSPDSVA